MQAFWLNTQKKNPLFSWLIIKLIIAHIEHHKKKKSA
jgi:hypothetical protein